MDSIRRCEPLARHGPGLAACELAWLRDPLGVMDRSEFEWGDHDVDRVFAMSDIHGDARLLLRSLLAIGVIDAAHVWKGGRALVVICGDLVDDCRQNCAASRRKDGKDGEDFGTRRMELGATDGANEWEVVALLRSLVANGARIVWVTGNHELMRMRAERTGHYQRHVSAKYETARSGDGAWRPGGAMRELFGPVRVAVSVGDVVFLHADPIRVHGAAAHETGRDYTRAVNAMSAELLDGNFAGLVWGRKAGHGFRRGVCAKLTRHIERPVLVVRGHCVTASAASDEARGVTIRPAVRATAEADFEPAAPSSGVTFACLRFARGGGVVSGIARVDCGASASIGLNQRMSVLEIRPLAAAALGSLALREHRFPASGGARSGRRLGTRRAA
jgi:hypothetical protein